MITILHGEDELASRKELDRMKTAFGGQVIRFEKNFDKADFYQAASGGLLNEKILVVVENFLSGKKKLDLDLTGLANDVVFYENREIGKTLIAGFQVREFKVSQLVWKFCDSLKPTNGKYLVGLFRETLKTSDAEFIFAMMVRQFRLMLNPDGLPTWQSTKIKTQAKVFGTEQLMAIYKKLLDIDYELKQGLTPFTITAKIEMLLLWI